MARRTKEEAALTRETIMTTALNLFCQRGLVRTSLCDVAKAAGVTRGAIYWHFRNKSELFIQIWEEQFKSEGWCDLQRTLNHTEDAYGQLRAFLVLVLQRLTTSQPHRQMFIVLFNLEPVDDELLELCEHMNGELNHFLSTLAEGIALAVRQGQLPAALDVHQAANMLHCCLDGYVLNGLRFPEQMNLQENAGRLVDHMLYMLTYPGH